MESTTKQMLVHVPVGDGMELEGSLAIPAEADAIVLFAHGSGSSRFSPRNQAVARWIRDGGIATLLMDLLTPEEERVDQVTLHLRFNIELLASRLVKVMDWLAHEEMTEELAIGCFGASTGAAAALMAGAERPEKVGAIVSRGGRPDLAGRRLQDVRAPTLLIVGSLDEPVLDLNREAMEKMRCEKKLVVVPGATHLFEEPGALEQVAALAAKWFDRYLTEAQPPLMKAGKATVRPRIENRGEWI